MWDPASEPNHALPGPPPEDWRDRVRAAALGWVGTPYRRERHVGARGIAADCVTLLIGVFSDAGLIERFDPPFYSGQEPEHVPGEAYVKAILPYGEPCAEPWEAGDVLMFRMPFAPSCGHAAVYVGGGSIVHADFLAGFVREDRVDRPFLAHRLEGGFRWRHR